MKSKRQNKRYFFFNTFFSFFKSKKQDKKEEKEKKKNEEEEEEKKGKNKTYFFLTFSESDDFFLRVVVGSLSLLTLPLFGKLAGNDFGTFVVTMNLRKTQKECQKKLNDIEIKENGVLNPHFSLIQSTLNSWERGGSQLMWHSAASMLSQVCYWESIGKLMGRELPLWEVYWELWERSREMRV